jgi:hypothetical protein
VTPADRLARTQRLKAERVARGQPELIQDPAVYRLLDALIAANALAARDADEPEMRRDRPRRDGPGSISHPAKTKDRDGDRT